MERTYTRLIEKAHHFPDLQIKSKTENIQKPHPAGHPEINSVNPDGCDSDEIKTNGNGITTPALQLKFINFSY